MVVVEARVIDATHLELAKPIAALSGKRLLVSVAGSEDTNAERAVWSAVSASSMGRAYGESEPEYSADMVKEANPEYPA